MSAEQHVYPPSAAAVKGAWVSGMPAYQALVDEMLLRADEIIRLPSRKASQRG